MEDTLSGPAVKLKASQGALVSMTLDGAVRAMVGGRDYADSQFNRATQGERQPGSSFKPFVYLAALERGLRPDSLVDDSPIHMGSWSPENFEPGFHGRFPRARHWPNRSIPPRCGYSTSPVSTMCATWPGGWASASRSRATCRSRWAPAT
jgi:hypothetical protein